MGLSLTAGLLVLATAVAVAVAVPQVPAGKARAVALSCPAAEPCCLVYAVAVGPGELAVAWLDRLARPDRGRAAVLAGLVRALQTPEQAAMRKRLAWGRRAMAAAAAAVLEQAVTQSTTPHPVLAVRGEPRQVRRAAAAAAAGKAATIKALVTQGVRAWRMVLAVPVAARIVLRAAHLVNLVPVPAKSAAAAVAAVPAQMAVTGRIVRGKVALVAAAVVVAVLAAIRGMPAGTVGLVVSVAPFTERAATAAVEPAGAAELVCRASRTAYRG